MVQVRLLSTHLLAKLDGCDGLGDLAGHKDLSAAWRLVVEQDAVACIHVVRFPVNPKQMLSAPVPDLYKSKTR